MLMLCGLAVAGCGNAEAGSYIPGNPDLKVGEQYEVAGWSIHSARLSARSSVAAIAGPDSQRWEYQLILLGQASAKPLTGPEDFAAAFDWYPSADAVLVVIFGEPSTGPSQLRRINISDGSAETITPSVPLVISGGVAVSPSEEFAIVAASPVGQEEEQDLFAISLSNGEVSRLTHGPALELDPSMGGRDDVVYIAENATAVDGGAGTGALRSLDLATHRSHLLASSEYLASSPSTRSTHADVVFDSSPAPGRAEPGVWRIDHNQNPVRIFDDPRFGRPSLSADGKFVLLSGLAPGRDTGVIVLEPANR